MQISLSKSLGNCQVPRQISKAVNNIEMVVYGILDSRNALAGNNPFNKPLKFPNIEKFHFCVTNFRNQKYYVSWPYLFAKAAFTKENMRQFNFKKRLKFSNIIQIFQCSMARRRNKKQDVSLSYLFTRTTLRKENTRQTDFKKPFKILCCLQSEKI